jgi:hypothetical protein
MPTNIGGIVVDLPVVFIFYLPRNVSDDLLPPNSASSTLPSTAALSYLASHGASRARNIHVPVWPSSFPRIS